MKQSVVASTATGLAGQATPQAQTGASESQSAAPDGREGSVVQHPSREKTPDTNVKLNQPLRCGRYGQVGWCVGCMSVE